MKRAARLLTGLAMAFVAVWAWPGVGAAQIAERTIVASPDSDYYGHDYDILKDADQNLCETVCLSDNQCQAFTFNTAKGWCFLKNGVGELRTAPGVVSGRIAVAATPAESQALESARADELRKLSGIDLDAARSFRLGLAEEARDTGLPEGEALWKRADAALASGDFAAAMAAYREALRRDSASSRAWLGLGLSSLSFASNDYQATLDAKALRQPAAVNAYLTATSDREKAAALDFLAQGFAADDDWKDAIRTWRASLAIAERPEARSRLDAALAEHGFRIVDNSVDNNAASPRICLNFSEPLGASITTGEAAGDYVKVEGGDALPVSASGSQICVEGVNHGSRYRIVARKGIPSESGEALARNVELSVYVRDRDPSVRLSGNAYVLPAGGEASIPVTSINTDTIEAKLLRIGDRALARTIGGGRFLTQLETYAADEVAETDGEKVWSGTVEVKRAANGEVTTAIPVAAMLKERKPGVYILSAKAKNARAGDEAPATQWFVLTDVGLTSFAGQDGFHVFARSLGTAEPMAGVKLDLVAINNEILGTAETDAAGHARFSPGLLRGTGGDRPALLMASRTDGDFSFLDMTASPFDLTDRGVEGREPAGALDVFLTTERGIYRAGDTAHVTALMRDGRGAAVDGLSATAILKRPDGVEDRRVLLQPSAAGGTSFDIPLPTGAQRGLWTLALHTDPKEPPLASASLRVEDFEPEKIDFDLGLPDGAIDPASPPVPDVAVRYLFGAPAAGLGVSGEVVLSATESLAAYPGYRFGLADDLPTPVRLPFEAEPTAEDGSASVAIEPFEPP